MLLFSPLQKHRERARRDRKRWLFGWEFEYLKIRVTFFAFGDQAAPPSGTGVAFYFLSLLFYSSLTRLNGFCFF